MRMCSKGDSFSRQSAFQVFRRMPSENDITININPPGEGLSRKQKRKERWYSRKMQNLKKNGFLGKHKKGRCHQDQPSPPNGANMKSSTYTSLPRPGGTSHCNPTPRASTHTRPSVPDAVKKKRKVSKATKPSPATGSSAPSVSLAALPSKCFAIDCEMVGAGPKGGISQLARCSIVSYEGDVVYDKFINPTLPVTDYRTRWSGIRKNDLVKATPFSEARKEILKLLMGKVVIGHAIYNDFKALGYFHPAALTRDTSKIQILNQKAGFTEAKCVSLKKLTKAIFNRDIQTGKKGHSSVEDAKATMELYKVAVELERKLPSKLQFTSTWFK